MRMGVSYHEWKIQNVDEQTEMVQSVFMLSFAGSFCTGI